MHDDPQRWRLRQLRAAARSAGLEGAFLVHLPTIRYLTRFSGSNAALLVLPHSIHFFTDDRYAEQVKTELAPLPRLHIHITRNFVEQAAELCQQARMSTLGIEADAVTVALHSQLAKQMRGIKLKPLPSLDQLRMKKFPDEIAAIRRAAQIASRVYTEVLAEIRPGMREREVAAELSYRARRMGSEGDAFEIIVVAGEHGAFVHGRASERRLRKGDVVTVDFGCRINGFHSDMTRTFVLGRPSEDVRRAWETITAAHRRALEVLHAGASAAAVDRAARQVIEEAGYGEYFRHSLGHGLGIEVHEPPALSFRNQKGIIPAGCVVTIEPGIYIPGRFGMRLEDDVYVGDDGIEILTTAPRALTVV
ncbi:MAG: Xaa-Pro peptidase family protein [Bacteroidota bacterium]|nr:Xaa-Pro peptidase family protein [Candidatus Kapabacteria bacterium]MDW8075138.1 Xaa-Pro peptidase family protein [Bacteroidota bacterium]